MRNTGDPKWNSLAVIVSMAAFGAAVLGMHADSSLYAPAAGTAITPGSDYSFQADRAEYTSPAAYFPLPAYAFAEPAEALGTAAAGGMGGNLELGNAQDVSVFQTGGRAYAVVASYHEGVQLLDVTDPYNVEPAGSMADGGPLLEFGAVLVQIARLFAGSMADGGPLLEGERGIAAFQTGERAYAAVTSYHEGVQLLDVTDPYNVEPAGSISGEGHGVSGAKDIAVFDTSGGTYAAVTSLYHDGVQLLDVTDPYNVEPAGSAYYYGGSIVYGAKDIAVFDTSGGTYAAVTSLYHNGVQLLDVTDPYNVEPAGSTSYYYGIGFFDAQYIAVFDTSGGTYAAVTSLYHNGVQLLDVTDPYNVEPAGSIADGSLQLGGARGIAAFQTDGGTYAAVTSYHNGVQLLDVTDPYNVEPAGSIADGNGFMLHGASGMAVFESGGEVYAAVASSHDSGIQILRLTCQDAACVP